MLNESVRVCMRINFARITFYPLYGCICVRPTIRIGILWYTSYRSIDRFFSVISLLFFFFLLHLAPTGTSCTDTIIIYVRVLVYEKRIVFCQLFLRAFFLSAKSLPATGTADVRHTVYAYNNIIINKKHRFRTSFYNKVAKKKKS